MWQKEGPRWAVDGLVAGMNPTLSIFALSLALTVGNDNLSGYSHTHGVTPRDATADHRKVGEVPAARGSDASNGGANQPLAISGACAPGGGVFLRDRATDARQSHALEETGSTPGPATKQARPRLLGVARV